MGLLRAPSALKTDWAKERKKSVKCTKKQLDFLESPLFLTQTTKRRGIYLVINLDNQ